MLPPRPPTTWRHPPAPHTAQISEGRWPCALSARRAPLTAVPRKTRVCRGPWRPGRGQRGVARRPPRGRRRGCRPSRDVALAIPRRGGAIVADSDPAFGVSRRVDQRRPPVSCRGVLRQRKQRLRGHQSRYPEMHQGPGSLIDKTTNPTRWWTLSPQVTDNVGRALPQGCGDTLVSFNGL